MNSNTSATSSAESRRPFRAVTLRGTVFATLIAAACSFTACKRQSVSSSPAPVAETPAEPVVGHTPEPPVEQAPAVAETVPSAPVMAPEPPAPEPPPAPVEPPAPPFPRAGQRFVVGEAADLPLPVVCRHGDLDAYTRLLKDQEGLPAPEALRFEQLLNAFDLRPNGTAAVAKGATVMAETLACPWKPSATLLLVRFENGGDVPRDLAATLHLEPAAVARYRLLGAADETVTETPLPTSLPAKSGTTLLVEMELRAPTPTFGQIRWSVDGTPAAPLKLARTPAAEPGDDARFASLLGAFTLWLAKDQPEILDDTVVAGLARECVAEEMPENRKQALVLIARALERK